MPTVPLSKNVLSLSNITKRYGRSIVLDRIDFDLNEGEIHGLIGENGAGKSTAMKLLAGVYQDYEGILTIDGKITRFTSPRHSQDAGIGMVHQELSIFKHLTVAENILGRKPPTSFGMVNWKEMNMLAQEHLDELGLEISSRELMGGLTISEQQLVEIARIIFSGAGIIILDEPTSALSNPETQKLFEFISLLKKQGKSFIFISHFLEDVLSICDRVTILKNGRKVDTLDARKTDKNQLVRLMIGKEADFLAKAYDKEKHFDEQHAIGDTVMETRDLCLENHFDHISFQLRRGEILGLFGFMGAGQTALSKCLFGAKRLKSGEIYFDGKQLNLTNTVKAKKAGIAFVPDNRHDSLMLTQEVFKNISLAHLSQLIPGFLDQKKELEIAKEQIRSLGIHPPHPWAKVGSLSGGNQQKVVLAKWLTNPPKVWILNEPARGMDLGAKSEVLSVIKELRNKGVAILLVTTEPELILSMADRSLVMRRGCITSELEGSALTKQNLMQSA